MSAGRRGSTVDVCPVLRSSFSTDKADASTVLDVASRVTPETGGMEGKKGARKYMNGDFVPSLERSLRTDKDDSKMPLDDT